MVKTNNKFEEEVQKWVDKQSKKHQEWKSRNISTEHLDQKMVDSLPFPELVKEMAKYYKTQRPLKHPKVIKFSDNMQIELENNEHKGYWEDFLNVDEIQSELDYHIDKVFDKVSNVRRNNNEKNKLLLKESLADCANILMFLGNAYNLYDDEK